MQQAIIVAMLIIIVVVVLIRRSRMSKPIKKAVQSSTPSVLGALGGIGSWFNREFIQPKGDRLVEKLKRDAEREEERGKKLQELLEATQKLAEAKAANAKIMQDIKALESGRKPTPAKPAEAPTPPTHKPNQDLMGRRL